MPRPPKPKQSRQMAQGRRRCLLCAMRLAEPLRARAIEDRLALGEGVTLLASEYGVDRHRLTRHWHNHCDQREILRRVHRQDRDLAVEEIFARSTVEGTAPLVICDRQIPLYIREFEVARLAGDREARDAADRRLFQWARLKHRILTPLSLQYGPQVQNNIVLAGAGGEFGALVAQLEQRLAERPAEERREFIALLREVEAGPVVDAAE